MSYSTTSIRAIPTPYGGEVFRSRLEARWAAFFDQLGLDWEYEEDGWELRKSTWKKRVIRYTPDFRVWHGLEGQDECYVEVKRDANTIDDAEISRICQRLELLADASGKRCVVVFGQPSLHAYAVFKPSCELKLKRGCVACDMTAEACDVAYSPSSATFAPGRICWWIPQSDLDDVSQLSEDERDAISDAAKWVSHIDWSQLPKPSHREWKCAG